MSKLAADLKALRQTVSHLGWVRKRRKGKREERRIREWKGDRKGERNEGGDLEGVKRRGQGGRGLDYFPWYPISRGILLVNCPNPSLGALAMGMFVKNKTTHCKKVSAFVFSGFSTFFFLSFSSFPSRYIFVTTFLRNLHRLFSSFLLLLPLSLSPLSLPL